MLTLKKWNGSAWAEESPKVSISTITASGTPSSSTYLRGDGAWANHNPVYYVQGNTTGTSGTWTGTINDITGYYTGLVIAYKIGIAGASTTTLNINGYGAKTVRRNDGNLTTHLPVGTVVILTYDGTYFVWADYDATDPYLDAYNANYQIGATIYQYKFVMMGVDGKIYPLTLENTTATTKTVASTEFRPNSAVYVNRSNGTYSAGTTAMRYYLSNRARVGSMTYNWNGTTGFATYTNIYIVGNINANGNFVLDNAGVAGAMYYCTLIPQTDDGKIYIFIGTLDDSTSTIVMQDIQPWFIYKDGKVKSYSGYSDYAANSKLLDGYGQTTSATGDTIVRRDANAYIYASYYNSNRGNETTAAASYIYDSGDGWMRKKTLANAQTELVTKAAVEASLTGLITTHTHGFAQISGVSGISVLGKSTTGAGSVAEINMTTLQTMLGLGSAAYTASTNYAAASHAHGDITSGGLITATAITPASTDYILLSDTSNSGKIARGIAIGTGTTTYLRNDGTWATPPDLQGVTSVGGTGTVSGISLSGTVTSTGNLTLSGTFSAPISSISDSTTVGQNIVKLTNPSTISFLKINADNTVTARNAINFREDLSLNLVTNESKSSMFTSPTFTGTPTAPTATAGTDNNQIATTAFVQTEIAGIGGLTPDATEWYYVGKSIDLSTSTTITVDSADLGSSFDFANYDYKFVYDGSTSAEDNDTPTIRLDNDTTSGQHSYVYHRVQITSNATGTESISAEYGATSTNISTGVSLGAVSTGNLTMYHIEWIISRSRISSSGIYLYSVKGDGVATSGEVTQSESTTYSGTCISRFAGSYGNGPASISSVVFSHSITAGGTNGNVIYVYRRRKA